MKRAFLVVAAGLLVAACASPQQNRIARGSGDVAKPADSSNARYLHDARADPSWAAYREFNFESATADISVSDTPKLREIVDRLASDSSLDVAVVGAPDTEGIGQTDRNLNSRRAASVRHALMDTGAGVASYKILMGPFADSHGARDGQIRVWVGPRAKTFVAVVE